MNKLKISISILLISMLVSIPIILAEENKERKVEEYPDVDAYCHGHDIDFPTESRVVDLGNGLMMYEHVHKIKDNNFEEYNSVITLGGSDDDYYLATYSWPDVSSVNFDVNPIGSGLDDTELSDVINASLHTWNDEIESDLFGNVCIDYEIDPVKTRAIMNYQNSVTFERLGRRTIAFARTWYLSTTYEALESDVVFNTRYDWSMSDVCGGDEMDVQSIATHEFGHTAGLLDLYDEGHVNLTMYGYSAEGETFKRDLAPGDIAGIQAIY